MQDDFLYNVREHLKDGEDALPRNRLDALRLSRQKALQVADRRYGTSPAAMTQGSIPIRFWPQAWGFGVTAATVVAVLIGLQAAEVASLNEDINRVAEIDKKVISDRLPLQAYLDPGFLVFQEQSAESTSETAPHANAASSVAAVRELWSTDRLFSGFINAKSLSWSRLTGPQREALAPLESFWPDFDDARKKKWLKIADRFHQWSPEEQSLAQERMLEWVSLPAIDRRQARAAFGGGVASLPEEVRVMKWNEYQKLSEAERSRFIELAQEKIGAGTSTGSGPKSTGSERGASRQPSALATHPAKPLVP